MDSKYYEELLDLEDELGFGLQAPRDSGRTMLKESQEINGGDW